MRMVNATPASVSGCPAPSVSLAQSGWGAAGVQWLLSNGAQEILPLRQGCGVGNTQPECSAEWQPAPRVLPPLNYFSCERNSSWPLNNMDLDCTGPLIHKIEFFSIANTTVLHSPRLVEPRDTEERQICPEGPRPWPPRCSRVNCIFFFNLFIFGCVGSSLRCRGFSLRWLLL